LRFPARGGRDQLKSDLIGQCMGGRDKCWKFQSLDQIKGLTIKSNRKTRGNASIRFALQLQASNTSGNTRRKRGWKYTKQGTGWKIKQVGLLSIRKTG